MQVQDIEVTDTPRGTLLAGTAVWRRGPADRIEFLYREVERALVTGPGDALLAAVLVPAMALGEDVIVDAPVSARLLKSTPNIVDFFTRWRRRWHPSAVEADGIERDGKPTEIGACFSGGVDSYYTALVSRPEPITTLVTMPGISLDAAQPHQEPFVERLRQAAEAMGKRLVVVDSNADRIARKHLRWEVDGSAVHQGAIVAAMALGVGDLLRRFHVPASWHMPPSPPWGSHPDLDPLWSTETLDMVHGDLMLRIDKVRSIAGTDCVLDGLHVCTGQRARAENCGRCDKCVATALMFLTVGAIDRCRTLERPTPEIVRRTIIKPPWRVTFERLGQTVPDEELRRAIATALRRDRLRRSARPAGRVLRRLGLRGGS